MDIRAITEEEILDFLSVGREIGAVSPNDASMGVTLMKQIWEAGESRPQWCFIGEMDGKPICRVGYWCHPSNPDYINMMSLHLPWDDDFMDAGRILFSKSLESMLLYGASEIEARVHSDSCVNYEKQSGFLNEIGMNKLCEKIGFIFDRNSKLPEKPGRLRFRTHEEVGDSAFINAMKEVIRCSLDRTDLEMTEKQGLDDYASEFFHELKDMDYRPNWWLLGYDEKEELVGLVIPQKFNASKGAINYIGVISAKRGYGFGYDLLVEGTSILQGEGLEEIIGDVDVQNYPMINTMLRAGFEKRYSLEVFNAEIPQILRHLASVKESI
jgi:ribosomal protein S18 acetylase RimI-like enzyme